MVEWLAFLLHILEDLSSDLGTQTGYSERVSLQSVEANAEIVP
jgi:hypothetical protein